MKVAVLTSGGVDSSVSLALLKEQGHDCTAYYIKVWLEDDVVGGPACPWEEDLQYVERLCAQLRVPLKVVNLQREYHDRVVQYLLSEVKAGRTPNPDVMCNSHIKFGAFFDSISDDFEKVATGHYARTEDIGGTMRLQRAVDKVKDQTYFLSRLTQTQLRRALFPIGGMMKSEVRAQARKLGLPAMDRKDSQGICFLGKIDYEEFVRKHVGETPGDFQDVEGNVIGQHAGHWFYTSGQRKRIPLGKGPWYVVGKKPAENVVIVSNTYHELPRNEFIVRDVRWIGEEPWTTALSVKTRHGPSEHPCTIEKLQNDARGGSSIHVRIEGNDQGLAPGQYAVFYDESSCLGSGIIAS